MTEAHLHLEQRLTAKFRGVGEGQQRKVFGKLIANISRTFNAVLCETGGTGQFVKRRFKEEREALGAEGVAAWKHPKIAIESYLGTQVADDHSLRHTLHSILADIQIGDLISHHTI